ncbi:MAG: UDP-N-acetylglucosamine--N-acetylmuramyl-(pentapeptide) pyrophosphoryl-undecaprenol N-acetylglucosamine transferase [Acidimicrobiia bacterium]|nr:UDP-N-acetylglucosamine--N-acetylmuramyl-(pentapeptide) pyrophosphoryl-undecaprenol N-acetylglucosamine transferase [Acidimicrobiia bacterium]
MTAQPPAGTVFAIVTGGGTAGHVLPAIAIAEALVAAGHEPGEVHYVGARRGIERRLLPPTPFPHTFLDVVGLQRHRGARLVTANVTFVPKLMRAVWQARRLVRAQRPRVVVSVGGYASLATVLAARLARTPVVVVSYDRRPGRASELTARFAAAVAVAYPDSPLPGAVVTGAPVRRVVLDVDRGRDRDAARRRLALPVDRFVVGVTGGSQGSAALNEAVGDFVAGHATDTALAVRHVVGERFVPTSGASARASGDDGVVHQVLGYDDDLASTYAAADVLVGRGGASTVAEVAVTGIPAILVPWSAAAEDHQTLNVAWLADQGGAIALPESRLDTLPAVIERLRHDPSERARLGANAHAAGQLHRGTDLVALIERVAKSV